MLGAFIIIACIWVLKDPVYTLVFIQSGELLYITIYVLLFVGGLALLSSWFACCGIFKRSSYSIGAFVFTLLVVVGFEIAACVWTSRNKDMISDIVMASVKFSIQEEYGKISTSTIAFDFIQKNLMCCGAAGPSDWIASRYNNVGREDIINIAFSSMNIFFNIPESCCRQDTIEVTCEIARKHKLDSVFHAGINEEGCVNKLSKFASDHAGMILVAFASAIAVQIIAIIVSLIFCYDILKNSNKNS